MIEYLLIALIFAVFVYAVRKLHTRIKMERIYYKLLTERDLAKRDELWSQFMKLTGAGK